MTCSDFEPYMLFGAWEPRKAEAINNVDTDNTLTTIYITYFIFLQLFQQILNRTVLSYKGENLCKDEKGKGKQIFQGL